MGEGPRIVVVGGGSNQWTPKLITDFVNTKSLHDAHVVLHDIDGGKLRRPLALVQHFAAVRGIGLTGEATTDRRVALAGSDVVIVQISTGGFESMRHDLEVPARFGVAQTVGDTVGPGGISRALRNIPVLVAIAHDMDELCPGSWLLNLTNPMTTLTRAVARKTAVPVAGVCHETTLATFFLSLLLRCGFFDIDLTIGGVNHLPFVAGVRIGGEDGMARLHALLDGVDDPDEPLGFDFPAGLGMAPKPTAGSWTRSDLLAINRVKFEVLRRYGVLPAAGDRHVVEFLPNLCVDEAGLRERWGVAVTTIDERTGHEQRFSAELDALLTAPSVSEWPSGETVAGVIDSLLTGTRRDVVLNLPNAGQVPDLPDGVVVESTCVVDGEGMRPRDVAALPPLAADLVRRISLSQELTVEAALTGDRDLVVRAMLADPLAGRVELSRVPAMVDDLLAATSRWLPQFSAS